MHRAMGQRAVILYLSVLQIGRSNVQDRSRSPVPVLQADNGYDYSLAAFKGRILDYLHRRLPPTEEEKYVFKRFPCKSPSGNSLTEEAEQCNMDLSIFLTPDGGVKRAPGFEFLHPKMLTWARAELIKNLSSSKLRDYLLRIDRSNSAHEILPAAHIRCPRAVDSTVTGGETASYKTRAHRCATSSKGMWWGDIRCPQFCKTVAIGALMAYMPTETVFDWGAGCGWGLSWLEDAYGVATTGHELFKSGVENIERFTSAKNVCHGDGARLDHVPDNAVDHVIANAAVYHLLPSQQCQLMRDHFLRIVRRGGSIWIGFNGSESDNDMHGQVWCQCNKTALVLPSTFICFRLCPGPLFEGRLAGVSWQSDEIRHSV